MCNAIKCENGKVFLRATQKCQCPADTPYEYNNACNRCQENYYFGDGKCIGCWEGSFYNSSKRIC